MILRVFTSSVPGHCGSHKNLLDLVLFLSYYRPVNRVVWTVKATKQLRKLKDTSMQKRIYLEAQALTDFPNCANVKKLVNAAYGYRLRVGVYRVLFDFDGAVRIVRIEEVRKRDERTY
jgi:mRNA interferase RelE/StbE